MQLHKFELIISPTSLTAYKVNLLGKIPALSRVIHQLEFEFSTPKTIFEKGEHKASTQWFIEPWAPCGYLVGWPVAAE